MKPLILTLIAFTLYAPSASASLESKFQRNWESLIHFYDGVEIDNGFVAFGHNLEQCSPHYVDAQAERGNSASERHPARSIKAAPIPRESFLNHSLPHILEDYTPKNWFENMLHQATIKHRLTQFLIGAALHSESITYYSESDRLGGYTCYSFMIRGQAYQLTLGIWS